MIEIHLPWPPEHCWPNSRSRSHWPAASAKEKARKWAWAATKDVLAEKFQSTEKPISVQVICHPKTKGPLPDGDNVNAACKAYFDGIADALSVNDRLFKVTEPFFGNRVLGGAVKVRVG